MACFRGELVVSPSNWWEVFSAVVGDPEEEPKHLENLKFRTGEMTSDDYSSPFYFVCNRPVRRLRWFWPWAQGATMQTVVNSAQPQALGTVSLIQHPRKSDAVAKAIRKELETDKTN
jgi:hypothetical protein